MALFYDPEFLFDKESKFSWQQINGLFTYLREKGVSHCYFRIF